MSARQNAVAVRLQEQSIRSTDARDVLDDLERRGLLAEGKAHLISVEAVRLALGSRWNERRHLVWDLAEAQIHRHIGPQDFSARLTEDDFLIITPLLTAAAAQLLAVRVLRDVLAHFLGESRPADIAIKLVSSFTEGELACRNLTPVEIAAILNVDAAIDEREQDPAFEAAGAGAGTTLSGRRLRFSSSVDPIVDLSRFAVTGHRIEPKIQFGDSRLALSAAERGQLLPRDLQAIDLSTLKHGLTRLSSGESCPSKPSLVMTISFLSLSNTRARTTLLMEANKARALMTQAVIWEVTDFEEGLPASRLEEGVALLKPFCRSVFARCSTSATMRRSPKSLGLSGLVVQAPLALGREEDFALWLLGMSRAVEGRAPTLLATNLPSTGLLPVAAAAGFTHATVRA
jgi:hypothetical protein